MTPDPPPLVERKEYLALPKWLHNDYKSNVADLEGWKCVEIARTDGSGRKDKVSILLLFLSLKSGGNHVAVNFISHLYDQMRCLFFYAWLTCMLKACLL